MTKSSQKTPRRSHRMRTSLFEQLQKLSTSDLKVMFLEANKDAAALEWKWMQSFSKLSPSKKAITAYFEPVNENEDDDNIDNLRSTEKNNYIKSILKLKRKNQLYSSNF